MIRNQDKVVQFNLDDLFKGKKEKFQKNDFNLTETDILILAYDQLTGSPVSLL